MKQLKHGLGSTNGLLESKTSAPQQVRCETIGIPKKMSQVSGLCRFKSVASATHESAANRPVLGFRNREHGVLHAQQSAFIQEDPGLARAIVTEAGTRAQFCFGSSHNI
ncbi:MAG: hypothetical protein WCH44_02540, partial [Betaproteobacteria bacterium]